MNLREFKGLTQYTNRHIARLIGCSYSAVQFNMRRGTNLSKPEHQNNFETIARMEEIIRGNPDDKFLLIQEYEEFTGIEFKGE